MNDSSNRIAALADLCLRRRGVVLGIVGLLTIGFALAALRLEPTTSPETILETNDPDVVRLREHEAVFGTFERRLQLVVRAEDVLAIDHLRRLRDATERVAALPSVEQVRSVVRNGFPLPDFETDAEAFRRAVLRNRLLAPLLVAHDARTTALAVDLAPESARHDRRDDSIDAVVAAVREAGLEPLVTGIPAVRRAYSAAILYSLTVLPPIVVVLLAGILWLAVRRIVPVVGLIVAIGLAAVWTVGILSLTGGRITALSSILPALLMVVGIAAGVHVIAQYREEREAGSGPRDAARDAMTKMAVPCALTSITTAVGFSALLVAGIRDVREFGLYAAIGSALVFVIGVPLTGILLSSLPKEGRWERRGLPMARGLDRLAGLLRSRPILGLLVLAVAVTGGALGSLRLQQDSFLLEDIDEREPVHLATRLVDRELGGVVGFDVLVDAPDGVLRPDVLAGIRELEDRIAAVDGVRTIVGPGRLLEGASDATGIPLDGPAGSRVVMAAIHAAGGGDLVRRFLGPEGRSARILVLTGDVGSIRSAQIRSHVAPLLSYLPEKVEARVAGLTVMAETVLERFVTSMARSTTLAFVVIFVLMTVIFRSLRIGALSMIPNILPLLVAAGFMGYAGITIRSSITLVFAVALGIAVDDTIHVLYRYRSETRGGASPADAVVTAVRWTGRPVVLSSVLLVAGFLTNLTATFKATQQFGLVAAVTIVAALVGDLIVLPCLLLLRGRRHRGGRARG